MRSRFTTLQVVVFAKEDQTTTYVSELSTVVLHFIGCINKQTLFIRVSYSASIDHSRVTNVLLYCIVSRIQFYSTFRYLLVPLMYTNMWMIRTKRR